MADGFTVVRTDAFREAITRYFAVANQETGEITWIAITNKNVDRFVTANTKDGNALAHLAGVDQHLLRTRVKKHVEKQKQQWTNGTGPGHLPLGEGRDSHGRFAGGKAGEFVWICTHHPHSHFLCQNEYFALILALVQVQELVIKR